MSKTNFVENFVAGGVGGACCIATGHPFDTVKVRLQTMPKPLPDAEPMYTCALDCVRKTIKNEGFRITLYKGMVTPLVGSAQLFAIFFGGVAGGRWLQQTHHDEKLTLIQNFNACAFAGIFTSIIVVSGERIKMHPSNSIKRKYDDSFGDLIKWVKKNPKWSSSINALLIMSDTLFIENFFAGGVGGACSVATGHPFDTVKVRLQAMSKSKPIYTGALDCARITIKNEGFFALYNGMQSPLISSVPLFAIFFSGCSVGRWLQQNESGEKLTPLQNFNTGALGGFVSSIIVVPTERVKCMLQVQSNANAKIYNGPLDTLKKLYKDGGMRNIYRGTAATLLREVHSNGVKMAVYEYLKDHFSKNNKHDPKLSPIASLFAGGFAGMSQWLVCLPADVIKSRLQTAPEGKYPNGIRSVIHDTLQQEGYKGFFRGFVPVMLRAFPANAAFFLGIELTLEIFRDCKE